MGNRVGSVITALSLTALSAVAAAAPSMQVATSEPMTQAMVAAPVVYGDAAPREVMIGRFAIEPFMTAGSDGAHHKGARFGLDTVYARGERATKLATGIRMLLGGDGGGHFGPEGALSFGVAHAVSGDAVAALVVPLGFAMAFDGPEALGVHGVVGLEGALVASGVDLGAGISNRGYRARAGWVRPGRESGFGLGIDWQRDAGVDLVGLYVASTPGRR